MSRKLIIHMGSHKTGTTSIQNALYLNRKTLAEQGYELFYISADGQDHENGHPGLWVTPNEDIHKGAFIRQELSKELAALKGNVVISQENFSWVYLQDELIQFKKDLSQDFSEILVVVYLRRQDQQAISHHQQASKNSFLMASRFYGNAPKALPVYQDHFKLYLDYYKKFDMWTAAFGQENIKFRVFDKNYLVNSDSVKDFEHTTGLEFDHYPERKNESKGFERTKINHLMSQAIFSMPLRKLINEHLDNAGKLKPARGEAEDFYGHFKDSNALLNKRFNITDREFLFSNDFSMYAEHPQDEWSEDSANVALSHLLNTLKKLKCLQEKDIDIIEEAARLLDGTDPVAAKKLRQIINVE